MEKLLVYLTTLILCLFLCFFLFSCGNDSSQSDASTSSQVDSEQGSALEDNQSQSSTQDSTTPPSGSDENSEQSPEDNMPSLEFALSKDNSYYIVTGIGTYNEPHLVIPDTHQDKPVKEIKSGAFLECGDFVSVTIPDTVSTISYNAFADCYNLVSVKLGTSVLDIKENAFDNCPKLVEVINNSTHISVSADEQNGSIGLNALSISNCDDTYKSPISIDDNGYILYSQKDNCYLMGYIGSSIRISVPEGVTEIFDYAFYKNSDIVWLEVCNTVTTIGEYSFYNCYRLVSTVLGTSVSTIKDKAFDECHKLVEVVCKSDLEIQRFSGENGEIGSAGINTIIFNKDKEHTESIIKCIDDGYLAYKAGSSWVLLGYVGESSDLTVPEDINEIYRFAFYKSESLTSIYIGKRVAYIGSHAFYQCKNLKTVEIWERSPGAPIWEDQNCGLKEIGSYTFFNCDSLKKLILPDTVKTVYDKAFNNMKVFSKAKESPDFFNLSLTIYWYSEKIPTTDYIHYWHYDSYGEPKAWVWFIEEDLEEKNLQETISVYTQYLERLGIDVSSENFEIEVYKGKDRLYYNGVKTIELTSEMVDLNALDSIKVGDTFEDVFSKDRFGNYSWFSTSWTEAPKVSEHFFKRAYYKIYYDENLVVTSIEKILPETN